MTAFGVTPSQTVGPFFAIGLPWPDGPYVVPEGTAGAIWIRGRVTDGAGEPVPDALIETWQADASGSYGGTFRGFGRAGTDADGRYAILTVKPGPVPEPGGSIQAPHLAVSVFARGLLNHVVTRIYFPDEDAANAADPILARVEPGARNTLIARAGKGGGPEGLGGGPEGLGGGPEGLGGGDITDGYVFDIRLQGDDETVFLAV